MYSPKVRPSVKRDIVAKPFENYVLEQSRGGKSPRFNPRNKAELKRPKTSTIGDYMDSFFEKNPIELFNHEPSQNGPKDHLQDNDQRETKDDDPEKSESAKNLE